MQWFSYWVPCERYRNYQCDMCKLYGHIQYNCPQYACPHCRKACGHLPDKCPKRQDRDNNHRVGMVLMPPLTPVTIKKPRFEKKSNTQNNQQHNQRGRGRRRGTPYPNRQRRAGYDNSFRESSQPRRPRYNDYYRGPRQLRPPTPDSPGSPPDYYGDIGDLYGDGEQWTRFRWISTINRRWCYDFLFLYFILCYYELLWCNTCTILHHIFFF